jgi:DNA polymerase-1
MNKVRFVAIDCETTGLDWRKDRLHGLGICYEEDMLSYHQLPFSADLRADLANPEIAKVGHNLRFDLKFLHAHGVEVRGRFYDTKVLAQLINENEPLGLKDLAAKYLGASFLDEKRELDRACSLAGVPNVAGLCQKDLESPGAFYSTISRYCQEDCNNTYLLFLLLSRKLKEMDKKWKELGAKKGPFDYYLEEASLTEEILLPLEVRGVAVSDERVKTFEKDTTFREQQFLGQLSSLAAPHIHAIEESFYALAVAQRKSEAGKKNVERQSEKYKTLFNWNSSDHLSKLLFEELGCKSGKKTAKTGKDSTSEEDLIALSKRLKKDSLPFAILEVYSQYKKTQKLLSTYVGDSERGLSSFIDGGRVYAEYLQVGSSKDNGRGGTVTGRLSSKRPNMQNLPKRSPIRGFFIPDPGCAFLYFDYSQLELRLAAHLSQDSTLLKAYQDGLDLHQGTADQLGIDRDSAKNINFAMIYDASSYCLAGMLEERYSVDECEQFRQGFFQLYKGYARYLQEQKKLLLRRGALISETGRVRRLPEILSNPDGSRDFKHALKQGYNFPIQSLGASLTKRAMIRLHEKGYRTVTQVHDSVILQLPLDSIFQHVKIVKEVAETIYPLSVPLIADVKILGSFLESEKLEQGDNGNARTRQSERSEKADSGNGAGSGGFHSGHADNAAASGVLI